MSTNPAAEPILSQGGGYGPPGGYGGPPPGAPPGGYGPPGGGGYGGPPGPGGYGPPGYGPPGGPGAPGGYGPPAAPYGAPYPPPGGAPLGPPAGGPNPELKKRATTWLVVSIVSLMVCGCCTGLIGAIFCFMAMQAVDQGNVQDAESKLKWGKIITLAGFGVGVVLGLISAVVYAAEIAAMFAGH